MEGNTFISWSPCSQEKVATPTLPIVSSCPSCHERRSRVQGKGQGVCVSPGALTASSCQCVLLSLYTHSQCVYCYFLLLYKIITLKSLKEWCRKDPHRVSSHHDGCLQTSGTRGWGVCLSVVFPFKPAILGVSWKLLRTTWLVSVDIYHIAN